MIDYQDHKDVDNAEKLKIFYDPSDSLDHLDFYNLKRSDCSEDAEASLLPDNWLDLTVADRMELNPYKCSDVTKMQNNGRCIADVPRTTTNKPTLSVKLKISIEEVIGPDKMAAEYRIGLDSPKELNIDQVNIQYKHIRKGDKCDTSASWVTYVPYRDRMGIDIALDKWRDVPRFFQLIEADVIDMNGTTLCFKASKTADNKHIYIDGYTEVKIRSWQPICGYLFGTWKICFVI